MITALLLAASTAVGAMDLRLPMALKEGLPTVAARLNQTAAVTLLIDTGAFGEVSVGAPFLQAAGVPFLERTIRWNDAQGREFVARTFAAAALQIGGLDAGSVSGTEWIRSPEALAEGFDGLIGIDWLARYVVRLDYRAQVVRLTTAEPASAGGAASACGPPTFPLRLRRGVLQVNVDTEKGPLLFQLDTGSTETFIRPDALAAATPGAASGGSGMVSFSTFRLGAQAFGRQVIAFKAFKAPAVDGVLGSDFFAGRSLCLDVTNGVASLQ